MTISISVCPVFAQMRKQRHFLLLSLAGQRQEFS